MDDDDGSLACPNCDLVVGSADLAPISIGCIFRHTKRVERSHRLLVRSGHFSEPQNGKSFELSALFSNSKMNWMPLPPILSNLHYNFSEIAQQKALQLKDVRVCGSCRALFIDDEEISLRMQKESAQAAKEAQRQEAVLRHRKERSFPPAADAGPVARNSDRKTDMVFTSLQIVHRRLDRLLDDKKKARQALVQMHPQKIDWGDELPQSTTKEIRRLQGTASPSPPSPDRPLQGSALYAEGGAPPPPADDFSSSPRRLSSARALVAIPPSLSQLTELPTLRPGTGGSQSLFGGRSPPSRRLRSAPSSQQRKVEKEVHDRNAYGVDPNGLTPLPFNPLQVDDVDQLEALVAPCNGGSSSSGTGGGTAAADFSSKVVAPFDVSLSQRFMHDLWITMCSCLEYGAEDDVAFAVNVRLAGLNRQPTEPGCVPPPPSHTVVQYPPVEATDGGDGTTTPVPLAVSHSAKSMTGAVDTIPTAHPFFPIYRKNQLRLPTPPIAFLTQPPSTKASVTQVEDEILAVDQQMLCNETKIFQHGVSNMLFADGLLDEERRLLQEIVADRDVVVSDDDPFSSFYDENAEGEETAEDYDDIDEDVDGLDDDGY